MRTGLLLLTGTAVAVSAPAFAAEQLKFGKPPAWVIVQSLPPGPEKPGDAPVALLLTDQQMHIEPGRIVTYSDLAMKILKPEGLSAGNLSIPWNPATDTVTVNKLEIHRGSKVVDVLAGGQKFSTMRRESGLEEAMLDGILTANIQPEGLQEGDVIELAATIDHSDPVMGKHVEANFAEWPGVRISAAHVRVDWPASLPLKIQAKGGLNADPVIRGDRKIIEISAKDVEPILAPKNAPRRFAVTRFGEATDFASWNEAASLMAPLYRKAEAIPSTGPLHDEVEKIRAATTDPKVRAEKALQLVQERIRYVALLMGQGGYVPADAATTWSRRFGDCKAKTALLVGLLHSLGIEAEPILVQTRLGDALGDRLPLISYFDHVLARTHIGGKTYYLDGTRTGDTSLEDIKIPNFGWALPLIGSARLTQLVAPPLETPEGELRLDVDASAGVLASAPANAEAIMRGDAAIAFNSGLAGFTEAQRQQFYHEYWTHSFDFVTIKTATSSFDKLKREFRLTMTGDAKMDWAAGNFRIPNSSIGFEAHFDRPAGPSQDAPVAVQYPSYQVMTTVLHMPRSFLESRKLGTSSVHETLAGVDYRLDTSLSGDVLTVTSSERSLVPEISYKDALAAQTRLRELANREMQLPLPSTYRPTDKDLAELQARTPGSANEYLMRAGTYLSRNKVASALPDLSAGLAKDPTNVRALAMRAAVYIDTGDYASAERDIKAAEAIEPSNTVVIATRGYLHERKGDAGAAIAAYSKAIEKDPGYSFPRLHRASLLQNRYRFAEAMRDYAELLTRDPKNVEALVMRSIGFAGRGEYDSAERDLAAAKALEPNSPAVAAADAVLAQHRKSPEDEIASVTRLIEASSEKASAYAQRANVYLRHNRYDEALADTDQALKLGYKNADLRVARANIFLRRNRRDEVAAEADAMVRETPGSDYAYVAAAKTYAAIGQKTKAMEAFDRALAIRPDALIFVNRAQVRPYSDLEGRIADLDQALKLEPTNVDAISMKASQLVLKGDFKNAIALYESGLKLDPNNEAMALGRAEALYKSGRRGEAERIVNQARGREKSARDFADLCWTEARAGIFPEAALRDCDNALKLDPRTRHDGRAFALLRLRRFDESIAEFSAELAQTQSAFSYMGRALAWAGKGDRARAEADRAEALKLNPDQEQTFAEYGLKL